MQTLNLLASAVRIHLHKAAAYRADFFVSLLLYPLQVLLSLGLWRAISKGQQLNGMNWQEAVAYFITIIALARFLPFGHLATQVSEAIYKGDLVVSLSRPVPMWLLPLADLLAQCAVTLFTALPLLLTAVAIGGHWMLQQPAFLPLFLAGLLMQFWIYYFVGLLAFWFEQIHGILFGLNLVVGVLSGAQLPLFLFPQWFQQVVWWTPFPYLFYLPTQMLLGKIHFLSWIQLLNIIAWPVLLWITCQITTTRGLKRFTGHGV